MKTVELGKNRHIFMFSEPIDCAPTLLAVHVTGHFWTAAPDYDDTEDYRTVYMWSCDEVTVYHPCTGVGVHYPVGPDQTGQLSVGGWGTDEDRQAAFDTFTDHAAGLSAVVRDWFCTHFET